GTVEFAGSADYDAVAKTYKVTAGGENMWATKDAFHFVWTTLTGDVSLVADISFIGKGKNAHRKACLIIRQGLDADAAYVDVAVYGDGLPSLPFCPAKGAATPQGPSHCAAPA